MTFDEALARNQTIYALGRSGWRPRFVAVDRTAKREPIYAQEPYGRADWAAYRLGSAHRERDLAEIRKHAPT